MIDLNQKAKELHAHNLAVGWWEGDNADIYTKLQLVSTEIAEATEGERKDLMDDKLPHRKMGEVELADALIRVLDAGERLGLKCLPPVISDVVFYYGLKPAQIHLALNKYLIKFVETIRCEDEHTFMTFRGRYYTDLVGAIIGAAELLGYDIFGAMDEKHEFNKTRADHKRENRQAPGGKSF